MSKKFILDVNSIIRRRNGSALMSVVVLFLVMVVVISYASFITVANYKKATASNEYASSYYVAEAGLKESTDTLVTYIKGLSSAEKTDFSADLDLFKMALSDQLGDIEYPELMGQITRADIELLNDPSSSSNLILRSTGYVGENKRILEQIIYNFPDAIASGEGDAIVFDGAILVQDGFSLNGGRVVGDIKILNPVKNSIYIANSNPSIIGDIRISGTSYTRSTVREVFEYQSIWTPLLSQYFEITGGTLGNAREDSEYKVITGDTTMTFPEVNLPDMASIFSSYPFSKLAASQFISGTYSRYLNANGDITYGAQNSETAKIELGKYTYIPRLQTSGDWGNPLVLIVGSEDKILFVDEFIMNGALTVEGTGTLTILVKENSAAKTFEFNPLRFENTTITAIDEKMKSIVVYVGSNKTKAIDLNHWSDAPVALSLLADDLDISVTRSNIYMNFVTLGSKVEIKSSVSNFQSNLFYAPNATVTYATSRNFNGSIVAKKVIFNNSSPIITYVPFDYDFLPFDIFSPVPSSGGGSKESAGTGELVLGPVVETGGGS